MRRRGPRNDNYSRLPRPLAEAGKALIVGARRATGRNRPLPDFLIVGAQRAGTTSLYRYLASHPRVVPAVPNKGVHYFDMNAEKSVEWYRAHFPTSARRDRAASGAGAPAITGEASPYYLFHPHAPARAAELVPEARVIAMLRDPVERAYSHYQQELARGFEDAETFEEALDREPERLAGEVARMREDPRYRSFAHQHHSYLARGEYAEQLAAWREHFRPERLLVLGSEQFFARPNECLARVLSFLELSPHAPPAYRAYNARSYAAMRPGTRARLARHYAAHNQRLYAMLGVDYGWTAPAPAAAAERPA
jgi:hypothetical protein